MKQSLLAPNNKLKLYFVLPKRLILPIYITPTPHMHARSVMQWLQQFKFSFQEHAFSLQRVCFLSCKRLTDMVSGSSARIAEVGRYGKRFAFFLISHGYPALDVDHH